MKPLDDNAATDEIVSVAANHAVQDIPMLIRDLGGDDEQAAAVQEALRLGLMGEYMAASNRLVSSGFEPEFARTLLQDLATEARKAAA